MVTDLCPPDRLHALVAMMATDEVQATAELEILLAGHPNDARLHFLKGSLAAAGQDYEAGIAEMRNALDLAPEYWIARYQLGFLLLTSGQPIPAEEAWGPLHGLAPNHYLRIFVTGLVHMTHDRFGEAIECFQQGLLENTENPAVNADIQLIVEELKQKGTDDSEASHSSVDLLLRQSMLKATRH
jgi:tetratricopeptide (TPR) repeat protein